MLRFVMAWCRDESLGLSQGEELSNEPKSVEIFRMCLWLLKTTGSFLRRAIESLWACQLQSFETLAAPLLQLRRVPKFFVNLLPGWA
jgi:hypothetical protein